MELIDYIYGLFIYVQSIPDHWITARLNTEFKGHAHMWYTEMKEIHGMRSWLWWKSQIIQKYSHGIWIWQKTISFKNDKYSVDKDPYEWCLRQSKRLKAIDPKMNIQMRNHKLLKKTPGDPEHAVKGRCNHNCTLDEIANTLQDIRKRTNIGKYTHIRAVLSKRNSHSGRNHYANNCPKAKKKVYANEKVPEEKSPTGDSDSDSMGDAIREQSDDDQDPREEFLVDTIFQEEILEGWMVVYSDDIIIYSETWEDHVQYIDRVLSKCTPINLKISLKKCNFGQQELLDLGHKLSGLSLVIPQNNKAALLQKPLPTNNKEMQYFLGFDSYYRDHIKNFAHITSSL
ncbi:hypothetical protein O181_019648 [Austropuccinia psidii MF-1]|uniref:Reverse transcriptase domain-containing protein n=1 Tax=Austropuccinia psidii MF-1 TaxID=1389203 RepID=A0A9Q3GTT1_9BASI|nr:hypothetical protein [Austropuccinia psidii MF-1]